MANMMNERVGALIEELTRLQMQIEALPGPRLHQDHDFVGEQANLERLDGWLRMSLWTPYWGQEHDEEPMLLLGGRDPWIETLELKLWECLHRLAAEAGCELTGKGAVSPESDELAEIRSLLPGVAAAQGWVFGHEKGLVQ